MGLKSRASGRANFLPDTSREKAWQTFAGMFSQGNSPLVGAAGGPLITVTSQSDGAGLDVGDRFKASSHADRYILEVTGCSLPDYLAYEIYGEGAGVLELREISIRDAPGRLILDFNLTLEFQRFSILPIVSYAFSFGRPAARELRTLLSTKGRANTSYFRQWTRLPIDYPSVIVR